MKAYKVKISGSYRTSEKDVIDFSDIEGVVPFNEKDVVLMCVRRRYAPMWITLSSKYSKRVASIRECYIDSMEEIESDFSFVGKNILDMNDEELQDLATVKDLREIPLYRKASISFARIIAYGTYSINVIGDYVDYKSQEFATGQKQPIIVNDEAWRTDTTKKLTSDEFLDITGVKPRFELTTRDSLIKEALKLKVPFTSKTTKAELYSLIYS
jgi:hypothetical protein